MKYRKEHQFDQMAQIHWDAVIIGGGVTGAGILLDLTSRGLKVLLVEKNDFASGTSSKSTKLIHGGLRYLKQAEFKIVRESAQERSILHKNAPHLVVPEKMLLPITKKGSLGKWGTWLGLSIYDFLANIHPHDKKQMLNKEQALEKEPLLDPDLVTGAGHYAEYRTDDARLVIELIKTSVNRGARAYNYTQVNGFIHENKKVVGVEIQDGLSGNQYQVKAKRIINATGAWTNDLRRLEGDHFEDRLCFTKGSHIVIKRSKFPLSQSIYFDGPDGRMIFAIPRIDRVYIGTTDIFYDGDKFSVHITKEEQEYLLEATRYLFINDEISLDDIISSWSGVRTLIKEAGKSESEISRKDEVFVSRSGLISIAGGKLTGYRKMAKKIGDMISKSPTQAKDLQLDAGKFQNYQEVLDYRALVESKLPGWGEYLVFNYGKHTEQILSRFQVYGDLILSELDYCLDNEFVQTPLDFYERRTGRVYFYPDSVKESQDRVIEFMAERLEWSRQDIDKYKKALNSELEKIKAL